MSGHEERTTVNTLHLAIAGYETVLGRLQLAWDEPHSDLAEAWLRDEVIPVCDELFQSRPFRLLARWPLDHLVLNAASEERPLVEAADAAIVNLARELGSVVAADYPQVSNVSSIRFQASCESRQLLRWVAARPWVDLVCPDEYFQPWRGLQLWTPKREPEGALEAFSEIDVPLGDYISRSLWARIDFWTALLNRCVARMQFERLLPDSIAERLLGAKLILDESNHRLKQACLKENALLREAAIVLVQVYAAYAPLPCLDWLPCPVDRAEASRGLIRLVVRQPQTSTAGDPLRGNAVNVCNATVLRQIALALHKAREFYDMPDDADDLIAWAKDRVRLLLVDREPREVYWDGEPTAPGVWERSSNEWNLLWVLACNLDRAVDVGLLAKPDGEAIRSRRSRLSKLLMDSAGGLDSAIETIRGQGYKLNLDGKQVLLLRDDGRGRLVPEGASRLALP